MKQTFRSSVARFVLLALAVLVGTLPALAQQTLGSLNGTVVDPSGAAVVGVKVSATEASINVTRTAITGSNGFFQIFNLPIGAYVVTFSHDGFESTAVNGIHVQEAAATTVNAALKVGKTTESVEVTANPLLNATDTTNGYTMDSGQIELTPLATGSFTQLAVLAPGVSAELLANLDSNAGLGNQNIWANGQRATSNTFQLNGVDSTNIFNGMTSSGTVSQRYNFGVGETDQVGGEYGTGTSVYESNGNSLPSPPPEFLQELRVNTSMYDAQQGATAGAQIDANTGTGTNDWHGEFFGAFGNNALNAAPFFFKQEYLLTAQQGVGAFPESLANPALHRWSTGARVGGPVLRNKLFFFLAYQHGYNSDQATGLSQLNVPSGLTDDRSNAGLENALTSWNEGTATTVTIDPIAAALMNAKLPNGSYMIPSAQTSAAYAYGVPNVTLIGTSVLATDQAAASLDYDLSKTDRLGFKYYYQHDPVHKPYGLSQTGGFPLTQQNGSEVGALDNTISIGPRLNWEQRLGYVRMYSNSYDQQTVTPDATLGPTFGIGAVNNSGVPLAPGVMPGLDILEFATKFSTDSPALRVGPYSTESTTVNTGYFQNRLNPSTNVIFLMGKHTLVAGGGYSYTQLNIENNRDGMLNVESKSFESFLEGGAKASNVIDSLVGNKNTADRYYRSNELEGYLQDKWQLLPNLSITAGVRYDYHGGLTEKYGNMFNFDPSLYSVTGTSTTGFTVNNSGFVVAPNNAFAGKINAANVAGSDSTLTGRQWGISPRIGFAWAPKRNEGRIVFSGGAGIYYDRGELFTYLSQPYGAAGGGGVFGVTQAAPLATLVTGQGKTLANPLGTPSYVPPSANPGNITSALQTQLNNMTGSDAPYGKNCGAIDNQENYTDCTPTIDFGAYGDNNVLPYTVNYTLKMQYQPRADLAVDIGYVGNRGRHSVIPIPFNEPGIATATNPIWGETSSYGWQTLTQNNPNTTVDYYGTADFNSIAVEPWNTASGGNIDFRVPYVGYNFNSALFKTVGVSAYDALETHLEKRLSHNVQGGVSYTWSHALDEQSDIGIFFTGDNPDKLRDSWGPADFDRTNILSANFMAKVPDTAKAHSLLSYITNGWNMTGLVVAQSGQPYSLYEFYGASGSLYVGNYPNLMNPVLAIKDPKNPKSAFTGNKGDFRGGGGSYFPTINPNSVAINHLQPGEKGIPVSTGSDPQDIYETDFAPSDQRNIFRQAFQKRADISFRKSFQVSERIGLQYAFNVFNVFNTTSLDVPQNQTQIAQSDACANSAVPVNGYNNQCPQNGGYLNYGQIVAANNAGSQQSALANEYVLPVVNGSGKSTTVPTTLTSGQGTCTSYGYASTAGCPNNGATFGSVTGAVGGSRAVTMNLHITF
jgi:hypothetical protein